MYRTVIMYNKNITTIFPELLRETELVKTVEEIFSDGTFLDNLFKRIPSLKIFLIFLKILPSIILFVNIKFRIPTSSPRQINQKERVKFVDKEKNEPDLNTK